jgi:hypothetical protein
MTVALRVVLPTLLVVLVKLTVLGPKPPTPKVPALLFTVKVTVTGDDVAVPEVNEGFSQLGTPEIEKPTLPELELS